jgi:hypothetical protein
MVLQRLLPRLPTTSKENPLPDEKNQAILERLKHDLAIIDTTHRSSNTWPTVPCSLWFETNAKVNVSCVNWQNCKYKEERHWQGRIIGRGIHGSLNALLIKYKNKASKGQPPLMGLLTICVKCRGEPDWYYDTDQLDQIVKETSGSLILSLSDEEIERVVSSKVIIMDGILMEVIKTVGLDGQWKEWCMLRPLFTV